MRALTNINGDWRSLRPPLSTSVIEGTLKRMPRASGTHKAYGNELKKVIARNHEAGGGHWRRDGATSHGEHGVR